MAHRANVPDPAATFTTVSWDPVGIVAMASRFRVALKHAPRRSLVLVELLLLAACGQSNSRFPSPTPLRAGTDLPAQFEPPPGFGRLSLTDTIPGNACLSPMHDPRNDTEIRMVRAANGQADYKVPDGRYGVGKHQFIRLDCNTGHPLGIVED